MTRGRPTARYLKPLTSAVRRRPFLVLDLESKDGVSDRAGFTRPFLAGVYDGQQYVGHRGGSRGEDWQRAYWELGGCVDRAMTQILDPQYEGWTVYAHNAGRFDYLFLLVWLMQIGRKLGFEFEVIPTQSAIQVLDVYRGGRRHRSHWRFLDSYRLIPTGLDKIARTFGLSGKLKHDLEMPEDDPRWEEYNDVDCRQLYLVVSRFHDLVETTLGGEVGVTAPSTAMKTFRRAYLKDWIPRVTSVHDFVRQAYYGGDVTRFRDRAEGLRYFDFNSSYPSVMREPMPASGGTIWDGEPHAELLASRIGFVECDVIIPEDCYCPPLPVRYCDKLCFPAGRLRGVWDYHELRCLERVGGQVVRWGRSVWFEGRPIFRHMVEDLYPYRDKRSEKYDEALAQVVKILLNSLYGKFGMRQERRRITILGQGAVPPVGAKPANPTDPDCLVWYSEELTDQCYIIPQISAHITALARVKLWEKMMDVFEAGSFVAYCDTDSLLTPYDLGSSTELGELKDEYPGETFRGRFIAPKVYVLESEQREEHRVYRAKGLRRASLEDVLAFASGATLDFEELEKVGTLARASFSRGPVMRSTSRTLRGTAEKRVHLPGGDSRPHVLEMW